MAKVLVILSGCGVFDGSEIQEAVCTLLHLDRHDAAVTVAAPNVDQMHVVDHLTGQPTQETRNVLREAARIARGEIIDLAKTSIDDFDAVILPGGFGAAKNLCTFATQGAGCSVHEAVEGTLRAAHAAGKPIGLICIAPAIGARLFPGVTVTIGNDPETASAIEAMGAHHQTRETVEICIDEAQRILSTPAYMCGKRIRDVDAGIGKLVEQVLDMAAEPAVA